MALTPIKNTIINLEDVFVSTEDGTRYVTDRFSLWRLDELAGRSKLADALTAVQDGCYTMTAGGAVRPNKMYSSVPTCARLLPEDRGDELTERLPFTFDYKKDGAQIWHAGHGDVAVFDARFDVSGYKLYRHASGSGAKPVSVFTRQDNLAGIIMPIRSGDMIAAALRMAELLAQASERVAS